MIPVIKILVKGTVKIVLNPVIKKNNILRLVYYPNDFLFWSVMI